jgi:hypothetical protein
VIGHVRIIVVPLSLALGVPERGFREFSGVSSASVRMKRGSLNL